MSSAPRLLTIAFLTVTCAAPLIAQNSPSFANGDIDTGTSTIHFSARQHDSDPVDGQIVANGAVSVTVAVDCFAIFGNRAAMSGTIVASSQPSLVGQHSLLAVEDNGQGAKSPPDRYTFVLISADDCHTFPLSTAPLQDVTGGHVHVKASSAPF